MCWEVSEIKHAERQRDRETGSCLLTCIRCFGNHCNCCTLWGHP